jgi:hypothetical protein
MSAKKLTTCNKLAVRSVQYTHSRCRLIGLNFENCRGLQQGATGSAL